MKVFLFWVKLDALLLFVKFFVVVAMEKCPENFMKCDHGHCIHNSLVCNGNNDCGDFSDERFCKILDDEFSDADAACNNGNYDFGDQKFACKSDRTKCLPHTAKCNGTSECPKGEDEIGCAGCLITQFRCHSGECIRSIEKLVVSIVVTIGFKDL